MFNSWDTFLAITTKEDKMGFLQTIEIPAEKIQDALTDCTVKDLYRICSREYIEWSLPEQKIYISVLEHPIYTTDAGVIIAEESGKAYLLHIDDYNATIGSAIDTYRRIKLEELEKAIFTAAGEEFNIMSDKQLGVILFEKLLSENSIMADSIMEDAGYKVFMGYLNQIANKHPIIPLILEYRRIVKELNRKEN